MILNPSMRTVVGVSCMLFGLGLLAGSVYLSGTDILGGIAKSAVVGVSAIGGLVLAFGVGRRLLSEDPPRRAELPSD